jgi:vacuolar-type H+-ATPase subunit I/STV1
MAENNTPKGILEFQIERKVINMGKNFLNSIEDLMADGWIIPEDRYKRIRKKVWDEAGTAFREIQSNIEKFDVKLKSL